MAAIVGLLRTDADAEADAMIEDSVDPPAPGAAQIPALVDSLRESGIDVSWSHDGPPLGGTPGDDLHLYRVIQEAMTNAARHGAGSVVLRTRQDSDAVTVEVLNSMPSQRAAATSERGHGLVGHARAAGAGRWRPGDRCHR